MNKLPVLIQREFWENRNSFLILPGVVTAFFILLMAIALSSSSGGMVHINIDMDDRDGRSEHHRFETDSVGELIRDSWDGLSQGEKREYVSSAMDGLGVPLFAVLWWVVFMYLMNSLYQDRRDRSILFWKSMPVSDWLTVAVKLVTALVCVPLIYFVCTAFLQVAALVMFSIATIGSESPVWDGIWAHSGLITNWIQYLALMLFYMFWALPLIGWVMLVSAFAKSVPLVWIIGVPTGIAIAEAVLTERVMFSKWVSLHTVPSEPLNMPGGLMSSLAELTLSMEMLSGIIVGGALIAGAIYLRGKADEI